MDNSKLFEVSSFSNFDVDAGDIAPDSPSSKDSLDDEALNAFPGIDSLFIPVLPPRHGVGRNDERIVDRVVLQRGDLDNSRMSAKGIQCPTLETDTIETDESSLLSFTLEPPPFRVEAVISESSSQLREGIVHPRPRWSRRMSDSMVVPTEAHMKAHNDNGCQFDQNATGVGTSSTLPARTPMYSRSRLSLRDLTEEEENITFLERVQSFKSQHHFDPSEQNEVYNLQAPVYRTMGSPCPGMP